MSGRNQSRAADSRGDTSVGALAAIVVVPKQRRIVVGEGAVDPTVPV
jgi:hypothetical protein